MDLIVLMFASIIFLLISKYVRIDDKALTFLYIILVSTLVATRNVLIPDTLAYISFYNDLGFNISNELDKSYFEPGFIVFSILLKVIIGSNYQFYFFVLTFIHLLIINKSISNIFEYLRKKSDCNPKYFKRIYPLTIYMLTYGFAYNYITLRAGLGFAIALLAFSYLQKSRPKAIALFLTSILFHNSVLVLTLLIPIIIVINKINKKTINIWLILLVPALFIGYQNYIINIFFLIVSKISFLALRFQPYMNEDVIVDQRGAILRVLILIFLGIVFSKKINVNKAFNVLFISYIIGVTGFALFINIAIIGRIVEMYTSCLFMLATLDRMYTKERALDGLFISLGIIYFVISNYRLIT